MPGIGRRASRESVRACRSSTSPLSPAAAASVSPVSSSVMFCGFSPARLRMSGAPLTASSKSTLSASVQRAYSRSPSGESSSRRMPGPPAKSPVGIIRSASSRQITSPHPLAQKTVSPHAQSAPASSSRMRRFSPSIGRAKLLSSPPPETTICFCIAAHPLSLSSYEAHSLIVPCRKNADRVEIRKSRHLH